MTEAASVTSASATDKTVPQTSFSNGFGYGDFMQSPARPRISKIMIHIGDHHNNGTFGVLAWVIPYIGTNEQTFGPWAISTHDDLKVFTAEFIKPSLESGLFSRVRLTHMPDRQFSTIEPIRNLFEYILEVIQDDNPKQLTTPADKLLGSENLKAIQGILGIYEN